MKFDLRALRADEVVMSDTACLIQVADDIRQLYTEFGLRPYRVFLVWVGWTNDINQDGRIETDPDFGTLRLSDPKDLIAISEIDVQADAVGVGTPVLLYEHEITPTPLKSSYAGVSKRQDPTGLTEAGTISVSQITMRYSEDFLMGLIHPFRDAARPDALVPGVDFFWEIQEDRPAGSYIPGFEGCFDALQAQRAPRRRFHVSGTPDRAADTFSWSVTLTRADGERGRDGDVDLMDEGPFEGL